MRREKVFCLPEEPLRNACVGRMTVAENLVFRNYDRSPFVTAYWFVKRYRDQASRKGTDPSASIFARRYLKRSSRPYREATFSVLYWQESCRETWKSWLRPILATGWTSPR